MARRGFLNEDPPVDPDAEAFAEDLADNGQIDSTANSGQISTTPTGAVGPTAPAPGLSVLDPGQMPTGTTEQYETGILGVGGGGYPSEEAARAALGYTDPVTGPPGPRVRALGTDLGGYPGERQRIGALGLPIGPVLGPQGSDPSGAYTATDVFNYANLPPGAIYEMKLRLAAAGYLDPELVATGAGSAAFDKEMAAALSNAMGDSNIARISMRTLLDRRAANAPEGGWWPVAPEELSRGQQRLLQINDDDLSAVLADVAPRIIGRRLDEAATARFIAAYRQMASGEAEPPQVAVAAENFAEAAAPSEAAATSVLDVYNMFLAMIGGSG